MTASHLDPESQQELVRAQARGDALGRYLLLRELGRGGMGVVYKAWDPGFSRLVAIKRLLPDGLGPAALARFAREAELLARLRHPGVCAVFELVNAGPGAPYLVQELVPGRPLAALARSGALDPEEVRELLAQAARAVAAAHALGVVHRDLKPANVMVTPEGRAVVLDFGLAKSGDLRSLTESGALMGTPAYMAPEQADGASDPGVDVYALGATLYECLAGHPPFQGAPIQVLNALLHQDPPPLARGPAWLRDLCLRCLAKRPEDRPGSAAELAQALEAGPSPRPEGSATLRVALALATVAVAGAGLAGYALTRGPRAPAPLVGSTSPASSPDAPLGPGGGDPPPGTSAAEACERGRRWLARGDRAAARAAFDEALVREPELAAALFERGRLRWEAGETERGYEEVRRAAALAPRQIEYGLHAAQLALELGRWDQAEAAARVVLATAPRDPNALDRLATALSRLGRRDEAAEAEAAAVAVEPGARFLHRLGKLELERGRCAAAEAALTRALAAGAERSEVLQDRVAARWLQSDLEGTLSDARELTTLAPKLADGHDFLGKALEELERPEEARAALDRALELDRGRADARMRRVRLRFRRKDLGGALADLDVLAQIDPSARVFQLRGSLHEMARRWDLAASDYARALELDPQLPNAQRVRDFLAAHPPPR
ncbi:MAG: protein kinase [Planctomycetota bacterium]